MSTFLDTLKGDSAILVGAGEGIARALTRGYYKVYAADPARSLIGVPVLKLLNEGSILYSVGNPGQSGEFPQTCDLVLFAFSLANIDNPVEIMHPWLSRLRDRGRAVAIEWYGGPQKQLDSETELHENLLGHLEDAGALRRPASRELAGWMRNAGLRNVRALTEPAAKMFTSEDLAFLAAEGISRLVRLGEGDSDLSNRLRSEALSPGTMILAHGQYKRSISVVEHRRKLESAQPDKPGAGNAGVAGKKDIAQLLAAVLGEEVDDPAEAAQHLLASFGMKALASIHDPATYREVTGIPVRHAQRLLDAIELGRRLFNPEETRKLEIHGPEDAYRYLRTEMADLKREYFRGLYLNVKRQLETDEIISIGTLTSSLVHPREVFGPAIEHHCHSILVAHNHPSGDPEPSVEDIHLTRELVDAGRLLGIEMLDHIIIGKDRYVSLKEAGHI